MKDRQLKQAARNKAEHVRILTANSMDSFTESEKEYVDLLRKLRVDFPLYAHRVLKIRTKSGEIQPLILNQAQQYIHKKVEDQREATGKVRAIILKGRQQGCSTYVEGRFYWKVSGEEGKRAFILTHRADATANIFGITKRYHDNCPDLFKPHTKHISTTELVFDGLQSEFSVATAGSRGSGRSATAQYFHGSEVGYWENAKEHMAGIGQIVPNAVGTEIILEGTANSIGNLFHGMWEDASRGRSEYIWIFVPWLWQKEYSVEPPVGWAPDALDSEYGEMFKLTMGQLYWRRQKIDTDFRGDVGLFAQEYPSTPSEAFTRVEGHPLIKSDVVVRARKSVGMEAIGPKIMGVDIAEYGDSDTAIAYRQGRVCHKIERFNGKGPMEVVGLVANRINEWRPDFVAIDCTGGHGVAERLVELGYDVIPVLFGERAIENDLYLLRCDELWGEMERWFDGGCQIPDDDVLHMDLVGRQYSYDSSRRKRLESKEKMFGRGLKSPDSADGLAITFGIPASAGYSSRKLDHHRNVNWRAV